MVADTPLPASNSARAELVNLWLFANLSPERTGLPFVVWVSTKDAGGNAAPHSARVKVSSGRKWIEAEATSVSILPTPEHRAGPALRAKDFEKLSRWITLNRELLLELWEGDIYHEDFTDRQQPVD